MTPVERQSTILLKKSNDVKHFGTSRLGRRSKVDTWCWSTGSMTGSTAGKFDQTTLIPSPTSVLGAGRVDPFANYPIRLKADEHLNFRSL